MCQQVPKSRRLTSCAVKLRRIIIRSHDSSPSGDVIFGDHGITTALIFLPCLYNATSACLYYIHCATLRLCISPLLYMHPVPRPWPPLHMSISPWRSLSSAERTRQPSTYISYRKHARSETKNGFVRGAELNENMKGEMANARTKILAMQGRSALRIPADAQTFPRI